MRMENAYKDPEISQTVRDRVRAEALFLRSFYYFTLVQCWGDVPLRLEATEQVVGLSMPRTNKQVVYDRIIDDIASIIHLLPKSNELSHNGTATQSAAQAILARIYIFRTGEHYRANKAAGSE